MLTLEEIYGAITFYLAHEREIDDYLCQAEAQLQQEASARRAELRAANPELYKRLEEARREREAPRR